MDDHSSPLMRAFIELRRRRVFRTAALYIVGGWVVMQVADVTFPALELPDRSLRYVLLALLAGFPAALVFGWFYDVTSHGIVRTPPAGPTEGEGPTPLRRADYLILAALLVVAGGIVYNAAVKVAGTPEAVLPERTDGPPMVAVLPFTTTDREGDSEFFATGVHDDLLTQLSTLQSLRVISRTSVMEYRNTARNLREIAAELGADVILEGGIQVAGEMIRINAQLIDARSDAHLWAETYDRQLNATNIFEVQSDISRAITNALRTTLTAQDEDQLDLIPTTNMAAYRAYREAMDMWEEGGVYRNPEYRALLEKAVDLDPNFTRALAELAGHLSYINNWGEPVQDEVERAEEIIDRLRVMAPDSPEFLIALAYYSLYILKDQDQALAVLARAEAKAPSDLKILHMKTWVLRRQGSHAARNPVFRKILELDPKNRRVAAGLASNLLVIHDYEGAAAFLEQTPFDGPHFEHIRVTLALREHQDLYRYFDELLTLQAQYPEDFSPMERWEALIESGDIAAAEAMLDKLYDPRADNYPGIPPDLAGRLITYWFKGDAERLGVALQDAYARLEAFDTESAARETHALKLDLALPPALEGRQEETIQLVNRWRRNAEAGDALELMTQVPYACRTLGMVGAAEETVRCLQRAASEPSWVRPFLEPHLPFYDPVRETPEFQALEEALGISP